MTIVVIDPGNRLTASERQPLGERQVFGARFLGDIALRKRGFRKILPYEFALVSEPCADEREEPLLFRGILERLP